jgi:hypothetical protein
MSFNAKDMKKKNDKLIRKKFLQPVLNFDGRFDASSLV